MKNMKRGFTLSELMIAMVVLGVLLAIVIPVIVNVKPDRIKMLTKKAYYITEQVVASLINDPQLYPDNTMYCPDGTGDTQCYYGFDDTSAVAYNGKTIESNYYADKEKFPRLFASQLNVKEDKCDGVDDSASDECEFTTSDGILFNFEYNGGSTYGYGPYKKVWDVGTAPTDNRRIILIDVNGSDAPNCLQTTAGCTSPDRFRIEVWSNGRINIYEDDTIAAENVKLSSSSN